SRKDGSSHRVSEATFGDDSGTVLLTLWDELIDTVEDNKIYDIKNAYCSLFKNNLRLNIGKYGSVEESEKDIGEVKTDNNVSDQYFDDPRRRRFGGGSGGGGGGGNRGGGFGGDRY
ncbi:hypothetical protein ACFLRC_03335, partial [Candidatus Altiarchaeota archaeon]